MKIALLSAGAAAIGRLFAIYNVLPCPGCHRGDGGGRNDFCLDCRAELPFPPPGPRCPGCGGELDGVLQMCSQCLDEPPRPWSVAAAALEYRGSARELLHAFKFQGHAELARPFGRLLAEAARSAKLEGACLVPVPLHWLRQWRRSYNQAELLAKVAGHELQLPVRTDLLKRVSGGPRQSRLNRSGRHANIKKRFAAKMPEELFGKPLILVDDVITTGATLTAAATALRAAGAGPIAVLTLCRAVRYAGTSR